MERDKAVSTATPRVCHVEIYGQHTLAPRVPETTHGSVNTL